MVERAGERLLFPHGLTDEKARPSLARFLNRTGHQSVTRRATQEKDTAVQNLISPQERRETMKCCGIDWANNHHDVLSIDKQGRQHGSIRVAHTREGLEHLYSYLQEMAGSKNREQEACIIETTHGLLMSFLLEHGWPVYPVNPRTVDRHRAPSGAKTDLIDASLLAKTGRADCADLRRLSPESELIQELKEVTRDQDALVRMHTRLLNQLTACLKAYYPVALTLFSTRNQPTTLAFLRQFPTPDQARKVQTPELETLLKQQRYPGARAAASRMIAQHQQPTLRAKEVTTRTTSRLLLAILDQLEPLLKQIAAYDEDIERLDCIRARREQEAGQRIHWYFHVEEANSDKIPSMLSPVGFPHKVRMNLILLASRSSADLEKE
jgi:transposase